MEIERDREIKMKREGEKWRMTRRDREKMDGRFELSRVLLLSSRFRGEHRAARPS